MMNSIPGIHQIRAAALAASLVLLLTACGRQSATRSDPEGRITFELPAGWTEVPASGGTRFRPRGSPNAGEIQVNTVKHDPRHTIEEERMVWLDFQRKSGQKVISESTWDRNGFHAVEFTHTAAGVSGNTVWHQVILQRGDYKVATYLMTPADQLEALDPVFRKVIDSIRPIL